MNVRILIKCWTDFCFYVGIDWVDTSEEPNHHLGEVDLIASNASLRKSNVELFAQLEELKTINEELTTNHVGLVEENSKIICQMDCVKDELEKEKAMGASLKSELETAVLKVQTMGEFKRCEHSSWDSDEEI